ncbi:hypothetical protein F442_01466 [Phytophthora nicotianae P10297]|uniref:G-protein coupled receptors family 3 profile domain-containing protein n=1 Tax=Phytophthora nicotianae P10297 TaxID=1317064 RepID=W3A539_PHYNI|nr:hypothetical protein F442_01466 [Phytophthora nicotianae P10297]
MTQLPNAKYHTEMVGVTRENVIATILPLLVFGLLQIASFVLLVVVIMQNCGMRALYQLAFVLTTQRSLVLCKMMLWMVITLSFRELISSLSLFDVDFLDSGLQWAKNVDDSRTSSGKVFTDNCMASDALFYGANQDADGKNRGEVDGTLVLDLCAWDTHALATMVLAIMAEEVSGYKVSISKGGLGVDITERMSSVGSGTCTPTHLNVEVWTSSTLSDLRVYFNESYQVGGVGYFGLSGVYTTRQFVQDGMKATPPYFPDFWKHYKTSDALIDALDVVSFKSKSKYYPPADTICTDGTMGCEDNCERTQACTEREGNGDNCLVLALMVPDYDQGYFQAVFDNLDIPAYFCFIGYDGVNQFAADAAQSGDRVLFYHYEPDLFHVTNKGKFDRVSLPRTDPERVKLATGDYGESGFGKKTSNPVDVDYPSLLLSKFAAHVVKDLPIASLFSKFTLSDTDINALLSEYSIAMSGTDPEPYFRAACNWVKANYDTWSDWHDRLPLCTFDDHIVSHVTGCDDNTSIHEIQFAWKAPNPGNMSLPNNCDGGVAALPDTIATSRSCDWIEANQRTWSGWIDKKPECDSSFYAYHVSDCDSDAYRTVKYFWKLPYASNILLSGECSGGDILPEDVSIDCEYMPTSSPTFKALAALAAIVAVLLTAAAVVVIKQRNAPIIRRSQYEMLLLMIFGGFFTTGAAVAYAGRPTGMLCGIRPVLVCMGFTTIFGALVMKSLRVYRVFMKSAMKRVKVTLFTILKFLAIFYVGDIIIFIGWYAADYPEPTITTEEASEFHGTVDKISCSSSSFIFTALLIFWKTILLVLGLYLSFLIRNVSVDFQESPWIFGSVVVVLVGCVLVMPMSYLVRMRAATYYVFLACTLLICTMVIMGLMLVPKLFRLKEVGTVSSGSSKSVVSVRSRHSLLSAKSRSILNVNDAAGNSTAPGSRRSSQQTVQVKPLHNLETITNSSSSAN